MKTDRRNFLKSTGKRSIALITGLGLTQIKPAIAQNKKPRCSNVLTIRSQSGEILAKNRFTLANERDEAGIPELVGYNGSVHFGPSKETFRQKQITSSKVLNIPFTCSIKISYTEVETWSINFEIAELIKNKNSVEFINLKLYDLKTSNLLYENEKIDLSAAKGGGKYFTYDIYHRDSTNKNPTLIKALSSNDKKIKLVASEISGSPLLEAHFDIQNLHSVLGTINKKIDGITNNLIKDLTTGKCKAETRCFLTTATCSVIGLPDDCWELQTLRLFRDTHLSITPTGKELIKEYYNTAPNIVKKINDRIDTERIWLKAYWTGILPTTIAVKLGLSHLAIWLYQNMFEKLKQLVEDTK